MKHIILSCAVLASSLPVLAKSSFEDELRSNCAEVKSYVASGKKFYDQKQYQKALEPFKQQAKWSSFCEVNSEESGVSFSDQAISTAFNNVGLTYAKLGQYGWARAWFSVFPNMKTSQFNLQQLPAPTKSNTLAGTYARHAGFGAWDTFTVTQSKNAYEITFKGLYMGTRSLIYGPNIGEFSTSMPLQKTQAVYRADDCRIDLKFGFNTKLGQQIQVNEINNTSCGFGHNVSAEGVYLKVE